MAPTRRLTPFLGIALLWACPTPLAAMEGLEHLTRAIYDRPAPPRPTAKIGSVGGVTWPREQCIQTGLIWLAKAQEADGHWGCKRWDGAGDSDVAVTGLALTAFLAVGYTHTKGRFKATVAKGLLWLKTQQRPDGSFPWKTFYEQGMATIAVCEAYGRTQDAQVRDLAQRAVGYIIGVQPDHGGFRYQGAVAKEQGDLSVSGWQMLAIANAIAGGLDVPPQAAQRSLVLLKNTYAGDGGSSYLVGGQNPTPSMSAIGMFCRQLFGGPDDEIAAAAGFLRRTLRQPPAADDPKAGPERNLYLTHYVSLALFQMGGDYWPWWQTRYRDPLTRLQVTENFDGRGRFLRGSWDPEKHQFGSAGGRVYTTAMALLCLEAPYRYAPFYRKRLPKPTDF